MKKSLRIITLMLAILMVLTSCSSGGGSSDGKKGDGDGQVTIRMIESLTSANRTGFLRGVADKYEAANPNVKIEIISPPQDGADEKISQMLMAKEQIDVVEVREQMIAQFSNNGWIAAMDDYVNNWSEKATLTPAAEQSMNEIGEHIYMVPHGFYQRCLFYRKDIFAEAGLEVPKTYAEMLEVGEKLTNPTENKYGYAFRGGAGGNQYYEVELLSWLGYDQLASSTAGFYLKDGDGKTVFTTPEALEALEYHKDLYEKASPSDSVTWAFSEMVQGFMNGTTAMLIQDSEVIINCEQELQPEQWGTAPLPTGPSGQAVSPNGYSGWGITSYTENPDIAADFILFLSSAENNTEYAKMQALIPIHTTATEDPFFGEGPFSVYMDMAAEPEVYRYAVRPQMYSAFSSYKVEIDQEFQKYLKDAITAEDLLKQLDKIWTEAYEEEGQLW